MQPSGGPKGAHFTVFDHQAARALGEKVAHKVAAQAQGRLETLLRTLGPKVGFDADLAIAQAKEAMAAAEADDGGVDEEEGSARPRDGQDLDGGSSTAASGSAGGSGTSASSGGGVSTAAKAGAPPETPSRVSRGEAQKAKRAAAAREAAEASSAAAVARAKAAAEAAAALEAAKATAAAAKAAKAADAVETPAAPPLAAVAAKAEAASAAGSCSSGGGGEGGAEALPDGWKEAQNAKGRTYYYSEEGVTQWKRPLHAVRAASALLEAASELPVGWRKLADAQGRDYYYHRETKTTQWQPPKRDPLVMLTLDERLARMAAEKQGSPKPKGE